MMKFIFVMQKNMEVFYNLILSFWVCVAGHVQISKIRSLHIFAISSENTSDEVSFLLADKYESFGQGDSITLAVNNQGLTSFQYLCNISRKT